MGDRTFSEQLVRLDALAGTITYDGHEEDFAEANRYAIGESGFDKIKILIFFL